MIFKLYEALNTLDDHIQTQLKNKLNTEQNKSNSRMSELEKKSYTDEILDIKQKGNKATKSEIIDALRRFKDTKNLDDRVIETLAASIQKDGLDDRFNELLYIIHRISNDDTDLLKDANKLNYIYSLLLNRKIFGTDEYISSHPYLVNDSLYDRSVNDFKYTLNALNLLYDPTEVKKYLRDPKIVDISKLMNGDKIKSKQEIYLQIEEWSADNEISNDKTVLDYIQQLEKSNRLDSSSAIKFLIKKEFDKNPDISNSFDAIDDMMVFINNNKSNNNFIKGLYDTELTKQLNTPGLAIINYIDKYYANNRG